MYGSCAKDLKDGGGKIEVFAIHELQDLKKTGTDDFEVSSRFRATVPARFISVVLDEQLAPEC